MSLAAIEDANRDLNKKPTREEVLKWIADLEADTERLQKTQLCGMDGHARSIHWNGTKIGIFKKYLQTYDIGPTLDQQPSNRTEEDAHARVTQAKLGSFVGATDDYLLALRTKLYVWIGEIDAEMAKRIAKDQGKE